MGAVEGGGGFDGGGRAGRGHRVTPSHLCGPKAGCRGYMCMRLAACPNPVWAEDPGLPLA